MKTKLRTNLQLSILCLFAVSCGDDINWIQGYWMGTDSIEYLHVEGDKIYCIYPDDRSKTLDYNEVDALFGEEKIESFSIFEIGKTRLGDGSVISTGTISIKEIRTLGEYIEESDWKKITAYLEENTQDLSSRSFKFLSSVQEGADQTVFFIEETEKAIVSISYDLSYPDSPLMIRFSKIDPPKDNKGIDKDVTNLLQKVFPNIIEDDISWRPYASERFIQYSEAECDYDPVYQTQDCYSADILPNPVYSEFPSYPNSYKISWKRYKQKEEVSVIIVIKNENGNLLIDNIYTGSNLLFDYTKPAVPFWE